MNLNDLLNAPTEFRLGEKAFKLREPTIMEQAVFGRWLEQRARESAGRALDVPEEDRRQLLRDIAADIASGMYSWAGPVCIKALQTPEGFAKLLSIVLADQGCTEAESRQLLDNHLSEIVAILMRDDYDPKDLTQLLMKLGLPADFLSSFRSSRTHPTDSNSTTSAASPLAN